MGEIADNIARVRERMARAAEQSGRAAGDVTLLAVSKRVEPERIFAAYQAGIFDFGENYYQEAREKRGALPAALRWHFIGHLQTNKAKHCPGAFALVQSVDSRGLALALGRRAQMQGVVCDVLIEVKLDTAAAKTGAEPETALDLAAEVAAVPGLRLRGLMGIAPIVERPDDARPHFARLRGLFERLPSANRQILSMGMSADFEAAIAEGATMTRIGTAIFGARKY